MTLPFALVNSVFPLWNGIFEHTIFLNIALIAYGENTDSQTLMIQVNEVS